MTEQTTAGTRSELDAVAQAAERLLAAAPGPLRRLRLQDGVAQVEMEWAEASAPAAAAGAVVVTAAPVEPAGLHHVRASMVGTFYRGPEPGAGPFVSEGDGVVAGQQIAILEAMKMMMPVEADIDGEVVRVLAEDGSGVEFGEELIAIAPRGSGGRV